tara:strand:+ start:135 stop:368 length:234 start_codon:yes stop_codon:yes gene_type:complete
MTTQQRNQQESNLNGKVLVWMETRENDFSELQTKWLSISDLSDLELNELHSQLILWNMSEGGINTTDRTCLLNWEKR